MLYIRAEQKLIFKQMQQKVQPCLKKIHALPFNQELAKGILPREKFIFYLIQDALYLSDFAKALALTGARCLHNAQTQQCIKFALGVLEEERHLHLAYLKKDNFYKTVPAVQNFSCFAYTNYLLKMASLAPVEEAVASLLPCFWVYREVVQHIYQRAKLFSHPYRNWIELYASEQFSQSVNSMIEMTNNLAASALASTRQNMISAFVCATGLEFLFWKSAYAQKEWII
jgi:thiaminase/transcriptional activator TenA